MTLRDIHFRYEDNISNPESPFACGIMIKSFAFHTTDAEGNEVFMDRSVRKEKFMHKGVKLSQLSVYWDRLPKAEPLRLLQNHPNIERAMEEMVHEMTRLVERKPHAGSSGAGIAGKNGEVVNNRLWILRPCSLAVQLTKNESQDYSLAAKFTIQAKISDIALGLSREQYEDILFVNKAFMGRRAIEAHFLQARCRPFHSARKNPREWWDYASQLVLARRQKTKATEARSTKKTRLRWTTVQKAAAERRLYIEAFRAQLRKGSALDPGSKQSKFMKLYEKVYPVDVIMAVRDFAEDEELQAIQKKKIEDDALVAANQSKAAGGGGGSWYGYFFGGATGSSSAATASADKLADVLTAEGKASLKQAYDEVATKESVQTVPPGCNLISVKLQLKNGSLSLYQSGQVEAFLTAKTDGSLALNFQPSEEWDTKFRLQRFEIFNGKAANTVFHTFCALSSAAKIANPMLPCVSFDASLRKDSSRAHSGPSSTTGGLSAAHQTLKIRLSAMPIQVMMDPSFLLLVKDFFQSMLPEQQMERVWSFATSSVSDWIFSDQEDELLAKSLQSSNAKMQYDVAVDMSAPVFVLPENVDDPLSSIVVVDLGQFSFKSDTSATDRLQNDISTTSLEPETLFWRLEVKNVQILLGRLNDLNWGDDEFGKFARLVQELNLDFGVETLVPSLNLRPSKERFAAVSNPNVSVQATIPQITVSLAEDQLVTLARIHSSILAQASLVGRQQVDPRLQSSPTSTLSNEVTRQSVSSTKSSAANSAVDKYQLKAQVSLGEIVVNLRESAAKDAFRLKITETSFDLGVFSSQYVLQARMQSLLMEDMLYGSSSCFRQLMSTGDTQETHLVSIDVTMYPSASQSYDKIDDRLVDREASFMVVDMKFNVLDVQWNPSSMSLLYRIATSYVVAIQHHTIDADLLEANTPAESQRLEGGALTQATHVDSGDSANRESQIRDKLPSQLPSTLIRSSLVQFSVTFNKDDINRQLVQLSIKDASLEFSSKEVHDVKQRQQVTSYEWRGQLGNFIATDLSMAKHPVYSPLVGLDESVSASPVSAQKTRKSALLTFSYSYDPAIGDKSVLALHFQPVRMVYYHQQILELADYLFEGILGTMVSQTLFSATQMLLSETESSVVFQVSIEKPTVILPLRMADPNHVQITAEMLSLRHFPTSAVHYFGTGPLDERRKVIAPGEMLASSVVRRSDCISLRLDYKQASVKNVNVFCVSDKKGSSVASPSSSGSKLHYQSVVASPVDLSIDVEDLASSDIRYEDSQCLPRFSIKVSMTELVMLLQRSNYLMFVGLVMDNFGAEQLQVSTSASADPESKMKSATTGWSSPSGRPSVSYTYSRTDLEAVTMELGFSMKNLRCILYAEDSSGRGQQQYSGSNLARADLVANEAFNVFVRPGEKAVTEIIASDFVTSLVFLRDTTPSITVRVASFFVRELVHGMDAQRAADTSFQASSGHLLESGSTNLSVNSESQGVLLVCTQPTQVTYTWDEEKLSCELELNLSDATGVLIPEAVLDLVDFFAVPVQSAPTSPAHTAVDPHPQLEVDGSESRTQRRQSITEIFKDAQGSEYAMAMKFSATKVAIDVPQEIYNAESPRISLGADLSIEYSWKPSSQSRAQKDGASKSSDFDIQSSVVVDARSIEVLVKNANRQGCHVSYDSSSGDQRVEIATMVQILEPCDIHVETSDLFPHAGQQQQIVAFLFTPIEMFVSYDDACIGMDTLRSMNESLARHGLKKQQDEAEKMLEKAKNVGGVLSPKTFANSSLQNTEGLEIHRYFTCEVSSMCLTVINDCDGCDMGLVQMQMQRCNVFMNVTYAPTPAPGTSFPPPATIISGGGGFVMMISYYNPDTRTWHQMCREWGLDVSVQGSIYNETSLQLAAQGQTRASENELHIILTANQPLDLLVTHGLLEVIASAGGAWNRRAYGSFVGSPPASPVSANGSPRLSTRDANEKKKHAPCVVSNETGLQLRFWLTNGQSTTEKQMLQSGEIADLHYVHTVGRGSGVVRKYASSDREDNMRLCIELLDSSFQAVQGIIFEQLGSRAFPLIDVSGSLSQFTLNCYAKLVDGRILLSISSQMKLVNNLSMPIQLLVNDPTWHSPVDIGTLYPFRESAIPVLLSLGTELRVRPIDDSFSWSAPIPVQTRSAIEQKVEASSNGASDVHSAIFCVSMSLEQSLRVVCLSEPIVVINKLPVEVEYCIKSPLLNRTNKSTSKANKLGVGARGGIWWSDSTQRPQFKLTVEGCKPSKWVELVHPNTKSGDVFSVMLERLDGRSFKLLIQVIEETAKSMHVFLYAEVWFINRTGLELVYGNEMDSEAYVPPIAARALVGNAQICAFSSASESSSGPPVVRIRMGSCNWSSRFVADPRRLSWQDECLSLRSDRRAEDGSSMLYEFGVSADYSTRHFSSITTLVSVIPRYLILNHTPHTLLLLEESVHSGAKDGGNAAHHILAKGDVYALYWVTGARSKLHASVIADHNNYGWSKTFSTDQVTSNDIVIPAIAHGGSGAQSRKGLTLQVNVKRGSISQSTFVIVISEPFGGSDDSVSPTASPLNAQGHPVQSPAHVGWDTFSLHTQIAGIIVTVADKKQIEETSGSRSAEKQKAMRGGARELFADDTTENVARLTVSRISMESNVSPQGTSAKLNVMGVKIEDLLTNSSNPVVLRPVFRNGPYDPYRGSGAEKYFLEIAYVEKPHAKYTWVEKLRVELQDVKMTTSMRFVNRLNALTAETISHFQSRSLSSSSRAASTLLQEKESDENILEYFVTSAASEEDDASMSSITGQKIYIESCEIEPVRVVVSFSREKGDVRSTDIKAQGFWLANLKFKIENACLTLDAYKITHAMATQEALFESLSSFYVKSVKSQALGLIDSIQVTSLVTSMVTGGVSSLMSTIMGKTDPSLATSANNFQYQFQTNSQIIKKHSKMLAQCRSSTQFVEQIRHLVYDWDSNHTGLEARGCVALGILNNSRHALVINARLNDGAEIRVLPLGRRSLASVIDNNTSAGEPQAFGRNEWRADRSVVVFAWGYTPTLLTSGDVYFTVQSNACNVFVTRKTARLKANLGYTATFTHQETQSWWSSNVVIVGDDIQAHTPSHAATAATHRLSSADASAAAPTSLSRSVRGNSDSAYDLFGGTESSTLSSSSAAQDEYEVVFSSVSLGIIAKQSGRSVIVRELCALPSGRPGPAQAAGKIAPGDSILTVSGMTVTNTTQFAQLVNQSPRPVVLRFRRFSPSGSRQYADSASAAFNLFGEAAGQNSISSTTTSSRHRASTAERDENDGDGFDLFGAAGK